MLTISSNAKHGRHECAAKMTGFSPSQIMYSTKYHSFRSLSLFLFGDLEILIYHG